MDSSRFTKEPYYGDFRDRLDELYETSSSFVHLDDGSSIEGRHIVIFSDLSADELRDCYKIICYSYEDSFDWGSTPLYLNPTSTKNLVSWRIGESVIVEASISDARNRFDELTKTLISS